MSRILKIRLYPCLVLFAFASPAAAQQPKPAVLPPLSLNYGHVVHATSTKNPEAQKYFEQGMALYYGFNHAEAVRYFEAATALDPNMALAWWGIALSLGPNYNIDVDPEREKQAYQAEQKALAASANGPAGERDYVEALATRYSFDPKADLKQLSADYSKAMRELAAKYPDDNDAATLYAESLMDLNPWKLYDKEGRPAPGTEEIVKTLRAVLARDPNHIGAHHLYIHAVEASAHPEDAMPSARKLAALAPEAGHLVHMPGHIFIRTGYHQDSLETNRKAAAVDEAFFDRSKTQGVYEMYYMHNLHFVAVESMYLGRSAEAIATTMKIHDQLLPHAAEMPMFDGFVALPSQVLVKLQRWDDLMKLPEPPAQLPYSRYMWHYSRAMALASTGKIEDASAEVLQMDKLAPEAAKIQLNPIDASNTARIMKITHEMVAARMMERQGKIEEAIARLKNAVATEDECDYDEPRDWLSPVRESLGGALLRAHRAAEAETVFQEDLRRNPNNARSLFGTAEAQHQQKKDDAQARKAFEQAWKNADMKLSVDAL